MKKDVFGAKLYAIGEVLNIALRGGLTDRLRISQEANTRWTKINKWANSNAAIARL